MSSLYICRRCKQPLRLDASLADLTPSSYDLLASTLATSVGGAGLGTGMPAATFAGMSDEEKLGQVPAPQDVKNAWKRAVGAGGGARALTATANGSQAMRMLVPPVSRGVHHHHQQQSQHHQRSISLSAGPPNESFVFLQDSVVQRIPSPASASSHPRRAVSVSLHSTSAGAGNGSGSGPASGVALKSGTTGAHSNGAVLSPAAPPARSPISPHSHKLNSTAKLFGLLSSRTELDHPLCTECVDGLLKTLSEQLKDTMRERDGYLAFEKELKKEERRVREREEESVEEVERRIERLREEERLAIEDLREVQREKEQLDEELRALEEEDRELEEEEAEFWLTHNTHLQTAMEQAQQLASLRAAYAHDTLVLEKLERTNVYNDAFCIGRDGAFGTINGLRLGRVGNVHVEWAEINAAWGQALLLLYTIARKLDFKFENYQLVPMGSFSRIEKTTGDKSSYELYGSGDLHIGRLLHNRRFDFAMVAFLDCLRQAIEWVKSQDPSVEFPHQIAKDKIGDISIKLQFGADDVWTRSLRNVLLALKLLLKWTTRSAA